MQAAAPLDIGPLLRPELAGEARVEGGIASVLPGAVGATAGRFEGIYGGVYDRVVQSRAVRRAVFGAWGSADPLRSLEAFVADAASAAARRDDPVLVDLPCGGGTLLPLLQRERFEGTVVEVDLAAGMLARALRLHGSLRPGFGTAFLRGDALDLPLRDDVADVVVSINGLHVVPDPRRFLSELARVTRPGGGLWIVTPVDGPSIRSRAILRAANALSITPGTPPKRAELRRLLDGAGFDEVRDYGGESIAGFALELRAA